MDEDQNSNRTIEVRQRPRRRETWRTIGGALLIVFGVVLLIERATGLDLSWVPLALGTAFLAVWWRERWYGFLVAGCILMGVGLSSLAGSLLISRLADGMDTIALGAGFFLIYVLDDRRGRSRWGFIVGLILTIVGLLDLAPSLRSLIEPEVARVALPVLIILIGLLLVARGWVASTPYRLLLILLVILAIFSASLSKGASFPGLTVIGGLSTFEKTQRVDLADVGNRTLVIESGSGDTHIVQGQDLVTVTTKVAAASSRRARDAGRDFRYITETRDDEVILRRIGAVPNGIQVSSQFEVGVFDIKQVRVVATSGDVRVDTDLSLVGIRGSSSDVTLNGKFNAVDASLSSGDIEGRISMEDFSTLRIITTSGDVNVTLESNDPTIMISTASGRIGVSRFDGFSSEREFRRRGTGGTIDVTTSSGDINID